MVEAFSRASAFVMSWTRPRERSTCRIDCCLDFGLFDCVDCVGAVGAAAAVGGGAREEWSGRMEKLSVAFEDDVRWSGSGSTYGMRDVEDDDVVVVFRRRCMFRRCILFVI